MEGIPGVRLPVYTLTFQNPPSTSASGLGCRMDLGDVVKVCVPHYKPKSYSMSAERTADREFDITVKVYPKGRASGYLDSIQIGETIDVYCKASHKSRHPGS